MKSKSGIVLLRLGDEIGLNSGRVSIPFDDFLSNDDEVVPGEGHQRMATLRLAREAGGTGVFERPPTYMASIHEYYLEDKGRGDSERDTITLDPVATETHFNIRWEFSDRRGKAIEIGFIAVGE